jgi:transposase
MRCCIVKDFDMKKEFIILRGKGLSYNKIASKLNVSKTTLIEWSKEFEREIANLKTIELEELQQMYYVQKQKRIVCYGSQLEEIITELDKRNLTDVPTEKLLELKLKYLHCLKREDVDLSLQIEEEDDLEQTLSNFNKSIKKISI